MRTQKDKNQHRKQRRRRKVRLLRRRIVAAKDPKARDQLIAKLRKISPKAPVTVS